MVTWNVSFPIEAHTSIIVSSGGEELSYDNSSPPEETMIWNLFNVELWSVVHVWLYSTAASGTMV